MNWIMRAITKMSEIQRDKYLGTPERQGRKPRKGSGEFKGILEEERKKRKENGNDHD